MMCVRLVCGFQRDEDVVVFDDSFVDSRISSAFHEATREEQLSDHAEWSVLQLYLVALPFTDDTTPPDTTRYRRPSI